MDRHGTLCGFARRLGRWRRLVRDTHATATIEFAILGSTFILLVCMTLELGMVLFTQSVMDNAHRQQWRL